MRWLRTGDRNVMPSSNGARTKPLAIETSTLPTSGECFKVLRANNLMIELI